MPKISHFRTPFESQRVHGYQTLLKRPCQHFYQNFPSIQDALSSKTSLLVKSEILGLFGNTLTADHMYFRRQMKKISATCSTPIISRTENIFWNFYCIFGICTKFCAFRKKNHLYSLNISQVNDSEKSGYLIARKLLFQSTLRE